MRYRENKIQVRVTELPAVTPVISEVKAKLGISPLGTGLGSDTITVTKDIGTTLNRWVDVLTSADSNWQVGTWTAQVRFENTVGNSDYSTGKSVRARPHNNPPIAFAGYNQVAFVGTEVTLTGASVSDEDAGDQAYLSHDWLQDEGPDVDLRNEHLVSGVNFTAPSERASLRFALIVLDPGGLVSEDDEDAEVRVEVYTTDVVSEWLETRRYTGSGAARRKQVTRVNNGVIEFDYVDGPELPPDTAPANVRASATHNSVTLTWRSVDRATGYDAYLGEPEEGDEIGYANYPTEGLTQTVDNLMPNTRYHYKVRGKNDGGEGPWSATASVVTEAPPVTPEPRVRPPTPTNDQWNIEYDSDNNRIQAKVISLPAVIPAISEARVSMEIGQPPNLTTVTKAIGVSLNTWVDVLTSTDAQWQAGAWAAHLRFENSVGNSAYSLPGKSVTVPTVPLPPPPDPEVVPPKPTDDQWNVRRSTDGIYANVVSLPTVNPCHIRGAGTTPARRYDGYGDAGYHPG